jgi:hypothetical protein
MPGSFSVRAWNPPFPGLSFGFRNRISRPKNPPQRVTVELVYLLVCRALAA